MEFGTPLRGAIIGFGFISSQGHAPAYRNRSPKDVEIVALADTCSERAEGAKRDFPESEVFSDYRRLFEKYRGELDFVDIATPPRTHAEIAHAALDYSFHVLCEKPLAVSLDEATALLDHAKQAKRVLFPCHNYRHAPVVKKIGSVISEGIIGTVNAVTLATFRNTHAKGTPEWETHWRRSKQLSGGGIGMDHGSHSFYLMFDWLKGHPLSVTAATSTLNSDYDTEDNFSAVLRFPNGVANCQLSWTAGVRKVIYALQGDCGAITVDDDRIEVARMYPDPKGPNGTGWEVERSEIASNWMDASHVTWFNSLFDEFKAAIAMGDFVGKQAIDAWYCLNAIQTAYRSAEQKSIELPLVERER